MHCGWQDGLNRRDNEGVHKQVAESRAYFVAYCSGRFASMFREIFR